MKPIADWPYKRGQWVVCIRAYAFGPRTGYQVGMHGRIIVDPRPDSVNIRIDWSKNFRGKPQQGGCDDWGTNVHNIRHL